MRKGQALLVTLLILSVVVTIALSVASRSVTEVQVSTTQDESTRALEAAEIGLERYLGTQVPETGQQNIPNINASYHVPVSSMIGQNQSFAVPYTLVEGDVATVDLPVGQIPWIKVCWGNGSQSFVPKIEVEFFYEDAAQNVFVKRNGYGSYSGFYNSGIGGSDSCGTTNTYNYNFRIGLTNNNNGGVDLNLNTNRAIFMRVRILGNGAVPQMIGAQLPAGLAFPPQGGIVESVGVAGSTSQEVKATVSYWDLPAMFDSAIFSGTSLVK
jgi:type II secretory pathway pseudopilin PulG